MNVFLRVFLLLVSFALIVACTSNPRVQSSHDDSLDISVYETYNFSSRTEIENPEENVQIGMEVELTFRKEHEGADFHNYYWKCRPLRH